MRERCKKRVEMRGMSRHAVDQTVSLTFSKQIKKKTNKPMKPVAARQWSVASLHDPNTAGKTLNAETALTANMFLFV